MRDVGIVQFDNRKIFVSRKTGCTGPVFKPKPFVEYRFIFNKQLIVIFMGEDNEYIKINERKINNPGNIVVDNVCIMEIVTLVDRHLDEQEY